MDPLARKLISIHRNGDEWTVKWGQGSKVQIVKDKERPAQSMIDALDGLQKYAVAAASYVDKSYHTKTAVLGVDFDWKGDAQRRNAIIKLAIDCGMNGLVKVQTPKKLADNNMDEKKVGRWDTNAVAQFDKLQEEALAFVDGARSQHKMPLIGGGKKKKGAADGEESQSAAA